MTTHEREITRPVDLCDPSGRTLDPAAKGWSRSAHVRANLAGRWGRTKRWDYWAVLAGDLVVAITYADVDYLGIASVWWVDLVTGETGGAEANVPLARGFQLPERYGTSPLRHRGGGVELDIDETPAGTLLEARWHERDGRSSRLEVLVELPPGHQNLHVVIPWSERTFQYTAKHQARPAHGTLSIGRMVHGIGDDGDAWGVLDVGRGRWPYRTNWNWGAGAGRTEDGAVVGLQLGGKWTEGTGFTENGVTVDGRLEKVGAELEWHYDWSDPMAPWRVQHPDGSIDLALSTRYDRHTKVAAVVMGMEVHQVFGWWSGHVTGPDGRRHRLAGVQGFAEECRARW
jgi:hypothetical protein